METSAFSGGGGFSWQSLPTPPRRLQDHHPSHHCSEEKSTTSVEVEVRSRLQVPIQMSIIAGLREIGMDPQPIIDEAIRSEVEEKLGVVVVGTDTPIRWLVMDEDPDDGSSSSPTNVTKVEGGKGTSAPSASCAFHHGCGGAVKRRAILDLEVTQLGPQAHLLQKNFLYHLANQISTLHEFLHSIDPTMDLADQSRRRSSSMTNPGDGEGEGEEKMKDWNEEEKTNLKEEKKDGKTNSTSKGSYDSLFKAWDDAKKMTNEMLREIVKHDREVSALACGSPATIASSCCCCSLPCNKASANEKINPEEEKQEKKGYEKECGRELPIPPVSSFMLESLDDDQKVKEKIWREERKVKCLEDERICSLGGPICFSGHMNNSNHDDSDPKGDGDVVMTGAPLEDEDGTDSDSEADYRAMGYTRL